MKLQQVMQEKCGIKPTCFTYPFGGIELKTREYLKAVSYTHLDVYKRQHPHSVHADDLDGD